MGGPSARPGSRGSRPSPTLPRPRGGGHVQGERRPAFTRDTSDVGHVGLPTPTAGSSTLRTQTGALTVQFSSDPEDRTLA